MLDDLLGYFRMRISYGGLVGLYLDGDFLVAEHKITGCVPVLYLPANKCS